jgi:hypothetical protein
MKQISVTKELATVGLKVVRGVDWEKGGFDQQDKMDQYMRVNPSSTGIGTIIEIGCAGWVRVEWNGGYKDIYPVGGPAGYALYVYFPTTTPVNDSINTLVTKENAVVGCKVKRGRDWEWKDQDTRNGAHGMGTITKGEMHGWIKVHWDDSPSVDVYLYRVGESDKYDLYMYTSEVEKEPLIRQEQVDSARKALQESIVKERDYNYGKSLKPNTDDYTNNYRGNVLYLPPKSFTLQRGERPEGRRLQS